MKAVYDITTKQLIIIGDTITTLILIVDEIGGWYTINDLENNPLYDIQLDFDDSIDIESENTELNHKNYNLQYVNLVEDKTSVGSLTQGNNWDNIETTIIRTKPFLEILGTIHKK